RARAGLPPFRDRGICRELHKAIRGANHSPAVGEEYRVVEFSVQNNHIHFIIEAESRDVLSRGTQGLAIRLARAVNRALHVTGQVWRDRYHARELTSPRAVRFALVYVLMNAKKHGIFVPGIDAFSSAPWFDGFTAPPSAGNAPTCKSETWLGTRGWREHGRIR